MKTIRFAYADMWGNFNPDWFRLIKMLKKKYDIVTDYENPDYVICGPFGHDFLKYDCPRILFLGEALAPDFNLYDYAIGFDRIEFGDRYLRAPLYVFETEQFALAKQKHEFSDEFYLGKKHFCNFIVSNGNAIPEREEFFYKLSESKKVDSAGRYLNNMPDGKNCDNKIEFQKNYKFSLAFENSIFDGYVTEKIVQAWTAGTIPIYYGGNGVEKDFNEDAFIDVSKFSSMEECIDYILYLDENPDEYLKIAKTPIYRSEDELDYEGRIINFFDNIFNAPENMKYRRNSKITMWGGLYEERVNNSFQTLKEKIRNRFMNKNRRTK